MGSLTDDSGSVGRILEFTTVPDRRKKLRAYGFLVDFDGELGTYHDSTDTPTRMHADLLASSAGRDPAQAVANIKEKLLADMGYKLYPMGLEILR